MGICNEIPKTKYKKGENIETPKKSYTAGEYNETPKNNYTAQEYKELLEGNYPLIEYNEKVKSKDKIEESNKKDKIEEINKKVKIEESNKKVKSNMEAPQPVSFKNNNIKNIIKMKLKIEKDDVNKPTKILYNIESQRYDCDLKELNESNTELFINEKKYDYKTYFIPEKEGIYEIQLNIKILMKNCCCLFFGLKNLQSLDLSSFNTQNVTSMSFMFFKCENIQNLDLSSFNTQNVTNMSYMFQECKNLQNLDLSSFNTQKVTDMSHMFYYCYNLKNLNLLSFNTQKVENMDNMFYNCSDLQSLDLSSFNTQNETSNYDNMFQGAGLKRVVVNVQDSKLISKAKNYSIDILYS